MPSSPGKATTSAPGPRLFLGFFCPKPGQYYWILWGGKSPVGAARAENPGQVAKVAKVAKVPCPTLDVAQDVAQTWISATRRFPETQFQRNRKFWKKYGNVGPKIVSGQLLGKFLRGKMLVEQVPGETPLRGGRGLRLLRSGTRQKPSKNWPLKPEFLMRREEVFIGFYWISICYY